MVEQLDGQCDTARFDQEERNRKLVKGNNESEDRSRNHTRPDQGQGDVLEGG